MKILILVNSLIVGGGAEKFAVNLGNEFYSKGNSIVYLTLVDETPKYNFQGEYFTLNQKLVSFNIFTKFFDMIINAFKIRKFCKKHKIELIISVGGDLNCQAILSKYLFKNKTKIIATHHGNPEIILENKITFNVIKFLYPKADKVVCVSKEMEDIFKEKFKIEKNLLTINNMLNIKTCLKQGKKKIPSNFNDIFNSGFIFINIGRLDYQKGQWFLIRSFKKVVDKHENAKLCIIGGTELSYISVKEKIVDLIGALKLENNVFLLGKNKNVFAFLNKSNCFVLSSLYEGLPITLIEALSTSIPIISTDCKTGPREMLCPELKFDETIEYPFFGNYGVLSMPFKNEMIFESIEDKPLSKAEEILGDSMIKMIELEGLKKKYSNGKNRAMDYEIDEVMKKWDKLLRGFKSTEKEI